MEPQQQHTETDIVTVSATDLTQVPLLSVYCSLRDLKKVDAAILLEVFRHWNWWRDEDHHHYRCCGVVGAKPPEFYGQPDKPKPQTTLPEGIVTACSYRHPYSQLRGGTMAGESIKITNY